MVPAASNFGLRRKAKACQGKRQQVSTRGGSSVYWWRQEGEKKTALKKGGSSVSTP